MKKFKEEDLILYLYKDASPQLTAAIEKALAEDDLELKTASRYCNAPSNSSTN
jgi:hypothetical protein